VTNGLKGSGLGAFSVGDGATTDGEKVRRLKDGGPGDRLSRSIEKQSIG